MTEEKKEELKIIEERLEEFEGGKKPWSTLNMKDKFTLKESVAAMNTGNDILERFFPTLVIRGGKNVLEVFISNVGYELDNTSVIFMIDEEKKHYFNASPGENKDSLFLNSFTPPQLGALLDDLKTGKELMIRIEGNHGKKDATISLFKSKRSIDKVLDFPDIPYSFEEAKKIEPTTGDHVLGAIVFIVGVAVIAWVVWNAFEKAFN